MCKWNRLGQGSMLGRRCSGDEPACTDPNWWKSRWAPYYDYKGAEWMNQKKIELLDAIKTNTLTEWKHLTPNGTNSNVHDYYFYMGQVPSIYGVYVDQFFTGSFPPLKQIKAGMKPDELFCKSNFVLLLKHDGSPACVKPESVPKLIERGWATSYLDTYGTKSIFEVVKDDEIFDVEYTIKGGTIRDMVYVVDASSLLVTINSTGEGKLTLVLPRNLIDITLDTCLTVDANPYDDRFFVLLDGEEIAYDEISVTIEKRILQIQFYDDTSNIEIIPICLI